MFVNDSRYNEPEKITIPREKPGSGLERPVLRQDEQHHRMNEMVENRLVPDCRRSVLRQQVLQSMRPKGAKSYRQGA